MTLKELLTIADRSYPEGWVLAQWDDEAGKLVSEPQGEPLAYWLGRLSRRVRHPGNHKYAWAIDAKIRDFLPSSLPYPKQFGAAGA